MVRRYMTIEQHDEVIETKAMVRALFIPMTGSGLTNQWKSRRVDQPSPIIDFARPLTGEPLTGRRSYTIPRLEPGGTYGAWTKGAI
jgi:hypothetical protein